MASGIPKLTARTPLPWTKKQIERVHTVEAQPHSWGQQCGNKRSYDTMEKAQTVASKMNVKTGGERFDAYRCPHCKLFHFGHRVGTKEYKFKNLGVKNEH